MALTKLTADLNVIQTLDTLPNDIQGLTPAALKAKYDKGSNDIKTFINDTLTPEIENLVTQSLPSPDGGLHDIKLGNDSGDIKQRFTSHLADNATIRSYGAHSTDEAGYSTFDNHDAIMAAIAYVYSRGGGTVFIPSGTWKTTPISLQGYKNIKLLGCGRSKPWGVVTTLTIIASAGKDVGLQFADITFPTPTWNATDCAVEGLYINCDNKVKVGINGNYDLTLTNITVRKATEDGIRLEDFSYPVHMDRVESSQNVRHGLYVRGHMTTKYDAVNCEFSSNGGYGIFLEGGASSTFTNCLVQSNVVGGLKLNYLVGSYLENLLFINFYSEANGTLLVTDPNYEGNYALVITAANHTSSADEKAYNIRFIGGGLNASATGGTYKIESVYDLHFDGLSVIHSKGSIPYPTACHSMFSNAGATSSQDVASAPYPFISSYGKNETTTSTPFLVYKGGVMGSRGRSQLHVFSLPAITAGASLLMTPSSIPTLGGTNDIQKGIVLFQKTSLLALAIQKRYAGSARAGTLTAEITYGYDDGSSPVTTQNSMPTIAINNATEAIKRMQYTPLQYLFDTLIFGIKLVASADYIPGADTGIVVYVLVES